MDKRLHMADIRWSNRCKHVIQMTPRLFHNRMLGKQLGSMDRRHIVHEIESNKWVAFEAAHQGRSVRGEHNHEKQTNMEDRKRSRQNIYHHDEILQVASNQLSNGSIVSSLEM